MKNRYSIENVIGKILSVKLRNKNGYGLVNSADLGRLLFLSSASQLNLIQNEKDFELILQQILDNPPILSSSYSQGLFGFLTLLVHFDIENVVDFDDNFFDQFDNLAIRTVSDYIHKKKDYDFLHGAQGILHFSLLRNNTASQIVLSLFIDFLEDRINNYGVYEIDRIGGRFEKRYNLGLAHGLPSIIISLARCINQGLDPNDKALVLVNKLCDAIMHLLINQMLINGEKDIGYLQKCILRFRIMNC